jgi:hypothetical protein
MDQVNILPDGSAFCIGSMPLPKNHWLFAEYENIPPQNNDLKDNLQSIVIAAAKYAIRTSTMNGKLQDFDPDAMVQNFIIGMLGCNEIKS